MSDLAVFVEEVAAGKVKVQGGSADDVLVEGLVVLDVRDAESVAAEAYNRGIAGPDDAWEDVLAAVQRQAFHAREFGSPDQPRVPAGSSDGGQWTSDGGGGGGGEFPEDVVGQHGWRARVAGYADAGLREINAAPDKASSYDDRTIQATRALVAHPYAEVSTQFLEKSIPIMERQINPSSTAVTTDEERQVLRFAHMRAGNMHALASARLAAGKKGR